MTLRLRRRGSRFFSMTEGRKSQIVLLDERRLDIIVQPKLHSYELLDLVSSHFKLREKKYFGLGFIDDTNHFTWLQADKRVLDHDFPKKTGLLILYFSIRCYVETIGLLRDIQTVELFYLNARQALFKGPVECDSETVFELAAHVLQASNGDLVSVEETREELKKLPLIPTSTLREHPSIAYCEDRVLCHYEKLSGTSRGLAIVNYMTIIENIATYGIHFYEVKDKKDIPWWLGISPKGIAVYDRDDRKTPRKLFTWQKLENLYYRDRKFSIEVSGSKRDESGNHLTHTLSSLNPYEDALREPPHRYDQLSSAITDPSTHVSVSRRTFGASNVDVHAWFAVTSHLAKSIWSMAVEQHQFYLDRKQSRSQLPTARSMSEIAADLCRSTASLPGSLGSDLSRSPSSHSLPSLSNSRYDLTIEQSDSLKAEREMVKALKARKEALEEALAKKTEELKRLCFDEGQLTGVLPNDTPALAPGEQVPTFRRRVGTAFSLSLKDDKDNDTQTSIDLSKLELEVELQGKISSAAHRLASDKTVSKYVRKQRRQSYTRAVGKLKEMEKKLGDMRRQLGKPDDHHHHHHHHHHTTSRLTDDIHRSGGFSSICQATVTPPNSTESLEDQRHRTALSPSHSSPQLSYGPGGSSDGHGRGYDHVDSATPSSVAASNNCDESSFRPPQPSYGPSGDGHSRGGDEVPYANPSLRLDGSHDSGFSSANNMYNLNSQRTSHYESKDHLRSPATSEPGVSSPLEKQYSHDNERRDIIGNSYQPEQYSNLGKGVSTMHYGSLDRQQRNYNKDAYRDVSPMRYNIDSGSRDVSRGRPHYASGDHGESVHPSNVILEVPVQHETSRTSPQPGSRSDRDQLRLGQDQGSLINTINCYSPRFQEGSGLFKDVDMTHIHPRQLPEQQIPPNQLLVSAHHTASQPTFHRIDRSISPHGLHSPSLSSSLLSQHLHHPPPPSSSPSSFSSEKTAQPEFHQGSTSSSPSLPRTIPIQHISSSHSSPPSSPTSLYPPPNSSPRGPSTPTSHAPSSLVTVNNFQPHTEVTKPYEISDFYRYSEKLRRQRIIDQYQRQLIGNADKLSRSSTPQSVESDGHSSHSSSSSQHHMSPAVQSHPSQFNTSYSSIPVSTRGTMLQYGRSASAPLTSTGQRHPVHGTRQPPPYHQHHQASFPPTHPHPLSLHPAGKESIEDPVSSSSSSSSYSIKTQGPGNTHYAYQSSYRIQQIHTSTKHSMYQSPQPMACKPVKSPLKPSNPDDYA